MTVGVAPRRPPDVVRRISALCAAALLFIAVVPPALSWIDAAELVPTIRFSLLALAVPALLVIGAPWRALGVPGGLLDRWAAARSEHRSIWRAVAWVALDVGVMIAWRLPVLVNAVARHPALVGLEALSLLAGGVVLWLELVHSPPLAPRCSIAARGVLAAVAMWSVWVVAYLEGMSRREWYVAFHHAAGSGLSATADRQASAAVLWFVAASCFMPLVFVCLFSWLRAEGARQDPTAERLRAERASQAAGGLARG